MLFAVITLPVILPVTLSPPETLAVPVMLVMPVPAGAITML